MPPVSVAVLVAVKSWAVALALAVPAPPLPPTPPTPLALPPAPPVEVAVAVDEVWCESVKDVAVAVAAPPTPPTLPAPDAASCAGRTRVAAVSAGAAGRRRSCSYIYIHKRGIGCCRRTSTAPTLTSGAAVSASRIAVAAVTAIAAGATRGSRCVRWIRGGRRISRRIPTGAAGCAITARITGSAIGAYCSGNATIRGNRCKRDCRDR